MTAFVPDPVREVLMQISSTVAQKAVKDVSQMQDLGTYVFNVASYFCASDPRYRDALYVNPVDTVRQFVAHAISFYVAYREILDRMEEEIERAYEIAESMMGLVERYKKIVKKLLRRALPMYIDEVTARMLVALADRYILAKALGIPVDRKFAAFVYTWLRAKGVEHTLRYLAWALGLEPEELLEVVRR
jgi:hypothetical protein